MPQQRNAQKPSNEIHIQPAIEAINKSRMSLLYVLQQSIKFLELHFLNTLLDLSQRDYRPVALKLLLTEEEVIVQHILDLDQRGRRPRLAAGKDMAGSLLAERHPELGCNLC